MRIIKLTNLFLGLLMAQTVCAQRVDFNLPGRQPGQVTADGFTPWAIGPGSESTLSLENGVKVSVACKSDDKQARVLSHWWKDGTHRLDKLVGDGIAALREGRNNIPQQVEKGNVELCITLSGLSAGQHSLLAYHNNPEGLKGPDVEVLVNGVSVLKDVRQTVRSQRATESGQSYVTFEVKKGKDVTISYRSMMKAKGAEMETSTVFVNGIVIDEINPKQLAQNPMPLNHDMHVNADNGKTLLKWEAATGAVRHHLFMGKDEQDMKEVAVLQDTYFWASDLYCMNTYYWRVDEEDAQGNISKGYTWDFKPRHLAFPEAEGYGKYAIGGRGGVVYHVTTLEDNNEPGSLRYGLQHVQGPRTIVFDVGGTIWLKSGLGCNGKYITIAGQTAPGEGILLRGASFGLGHDVICQYIRQRLGHGRTSDGMGCAGGENTMIDHCSIAWSSDEGFSSRGARTISFQHNIISEALNVAGHKNYPEGTKHGYAATIGGDISSYHHNLMAHNEGRNWSMSGALDGAGYYAGRLDLFNNVCYNWGGRTTDGGAHEVNFVNNYYKEGPASHNKFLFSADLEGTGKGSQSAYVSGNIREEYGTGKLVTDKEGDTYRYYVPSGRVTNWEVYGDSPEGQQLETKANAKRDPNTTRVRNRRNRPERVQKVDWQVFSDRPFFPSLANIESARSAWKNVMSDTGCNLPAIDAHDKRVITEAINGTYSAVGSRSGLKGLIDHEDDCGGDAKNPVSASKREAGFDTDGDGLPDWWEKLKGTNPRSAKNDFTDANADPDHDGYTNLEDYIHWMSKPNFMLKGQQVINLQDYFAGYTNNPKYLVVEDGGLGCTIKDGKLTVSANKAKSGLYSVTIYCTDDDRVASLERRFNFAIK